ncbi:MAG TPA: cytochrome P450 [Candidatus Dormibacteraeota bacterium]|nr:cytochrome P450 [Candidatus Dormibacteraeota bacterium]
MAIETVDRPASSIPGVDAFDLVDPARFARNGYPHAVWTRLRVEAPVAHFAPPGYQAFWAVTKHADIVEISSQPVRFSNAHGIILGRAGAVAMPSEMVVTLDPPRHGPMRRVASRRFTPRAVQAQHAHIERIAVEILDRAATGDAEGECDFVERIAAPLPLAVIAWILGVPRADWELLYRWTNEVIGKDDPEFRRPGETPGQTIRRARGELHGYLARLIEQRRRDPQDDMVSELLRARIGDQPLTHEQLLAYCELMVEAGNETTRNAISGGLLAFSEHRGEWEKLRQHPELLPSAVEEVLRWVSPIIHFTRTATEDCEVRGAQIRAGEKVAIFFASANRDEDVFADPFGFRVDRHPNPHLAFGSGEHICLGAHVARIEIETIFRLLLARMERFEVAGPVQRLSSAVNGGLKHLPIRYRLA